MIASLLGRTGLALALAAVALPASAMPMLRGDVTVTAPIVTVGDLFDNAGASAETAIFRAPAPGTTGTVTVNDLQSALNAAGVSQFDTFGLDAIKVSRVGTAIDQDMITDLIAADLRQRGILNASMEMELSLDTPLPELVATDPARPATLVMLRYMPNSSSFSARIEIAGASAPLELSGQIALMIEAPHLVRTLPQGTILGRNDVEMRLVPLAYAESAGLVPLEQLVGMQLQRQTRGGVMLRPADIATPLIVGRNDSVTVVYRNGPMTLTTTGKALNAASLSEPVSVLNLMTNRVLQGTATAEGTVVVTSGPQHIAGL